jgi:hypothetical protein
MSFNPILRIDTMQTQENAIPDPLCLPNRRFSTGDRISRPVTHQEIFATLYTCLGLNLSQVRLFDPAGRPQYLVDPEVGPMKELL